MTEPLTPPDCDLARMEREIQLLEQARLALPFGGLPGHRRLLGRQIRDLRLKAARLRGTHTDAEWATLVLRFAGKCVRCGKPCDNPDKDHIVPLCSGGSDAIGNLQPICPRCNCAKGLESTNWVAYREAHGFEAAP